MNEVLQLAQDVRTRDYRRFLAIQRAPAPIRAPLYALTAFNAEIASAAEIASDPMIGAIRLTWWHEAIEEIAAGKIPRAHPVVAGITDCIQHHNIAPEALLAMVSAREADLDPTLLRDEPAFLRYLDATAGALHALWAQILGTPDSAPLSRGYAWIGLLRAIPYMAAAGIHRFPQNFSISFAQPSAELSVFVQTQHAKAHGFLHEARKKKQVLPATHRALLRIALQDAADLASARFDPYDLSLARPQKLTFAWRVAWA